MTEKKLLIEIIKAYMRLYPAFRIRGVGAPNSYARKVQEDAIKLEDEAKEALKQHENPVLGKSSRRDI
jgi:hypothetical protein